MWESADVTALEFLVALAILVGIAGIILPVLPGVLLIWAAMLVWAFSMASGSGWVVFGVATLILITGQIVKYLIPGRQLTATVPTRTLVVGAIGAVVGFFVIPVVGVLLGFPIGVYVAELARVGAKSAGASTRRALRAIGLSILIELGSAVLAIGTWIAGVVTVTP